MLRYKVLIGMLVGGLSVTAAAEEPLRLGDQELDRVTAGYSGGSLSASGLSFAFGNLSSLSVLTYANFQELNTIDNSGFSNTTQTLGLAQIRSSSSGFGAGGSRASGSSFSLIALP